MRIEDLPLAHTPPGGYGEVMPPPIYDGCDEALVDGAPDLRGVWRAVAVDWKMGDAPDPNPVADHVERIEQAGDRICVTSTGVIHDMRADGTVENGVNDVSPDGTSVSVVCTYEKGVHVLRPVGMPGVEVTRYLDGDQLVWTYGPLFVARLERISS